MMSYTFTLHGTWSAYTPDPLPEGFPPNVLFARNADGADWYSYRRDLEANAGANAVFVTALPIAAEVAATLTANAANSANPQYLTLAIDRDVHGIFPLDCLLIEVDGVDPADPKPWQAIEQQVFDAVALTLTPKVAPPVRQITFKKDIWTRATDAEADTIAQVLAKQTTRQQRIFDDAQYLDHADPLYQTLYQGFVDQFGAARAGQLLAVS